MSISSVKVKMLMSLGFLVLMNPDEKQELKISTPQGSKHWLQGVLVNKGLVKKTDPMKFSFCNFSAETSSKLENSCLSLHIITRVLCGVGAMNFNIQ